MAAVAPRLWGPGGAWYRACIVRGGIGHASTGPWVWAAVGLLLLTLALTLTLTLNLTLTLTLEAAHPWSWPYGPGL